MEYLLLIYDNEANFAKMNEAELGAMIHGVWTLHPEHPRIRESSRRATVTACFNGDHRTRAGRQTGGDGWPFRGDTRATGRLLSDRGQGFGRSVGYRRKGAVGSNRVD